VKTPDLSKRKLGLDSLVAVEIGQHKYTNLKGYQRSDKKRRAREND